MSTEKKRILVADSSDVFVLALRAEQAHDYEILHTKNGEETVSKLASFKPHLVITALMLPGMDGIEILRKIRAQPETKKIGVILASYQPMVQVYHAAIALGANYFQMRPCPAETIRSLCLRWFAGLLQPDPFHPLGQIATEGEHCYVPRIHRPDRYLRFWGTRGSSPVAGPEYIRYGGNTSCLEVRSERDLIIIDAGSGIRPLGDELVAQGVRHIHLFLGHTHWDHIIGFPFFAPLFNPDIQVSIWAPVGFEKGPREMFVEMLAYTYFPVRLEDIQAKITFHEMRDSQTITIGNIRIQTHYAFHPGSTLCFKVDTGKTTFGYVTDNEMLMGYHGHPNAIKPDDALLDPHRSLIRFLKGVDYLIHEAQYDSFEYLGKTGWGHSSISNAAVLIKYCETPEWIVTHHDPRHTDIELQEKREVHSDILHDCQLTCQVRMAYDGFTLPI